MRCPHCAGEIHDQSRFCGICGRGLDLPGPGPANRSWVPDGPGPLSSASLFELPVAPRARAARLALVLGLDTILVGVGIALIISYVNAREHARARARGGTSEQPLSSGSTVEILAPTQVTSSSDPPPPAAEPSARSTPSRSRSADRASPHARTPEPGGARAPTSDPAAPLPRSQPATPSAPHPPLGGDHIGAEPTASAEVEAGAPSEAAMEMLTRQVAGVVSSHRSQFERCSRQVAKAAGPVQGNVVIRFAIRSDGRASDVRASDNTTGSDRLAACLVAQFQSWTFPEHGGAEPVAFLWPLVFKAPQ